MHHSSVKFQLGEIAYITFKSLVKMLHVFAGVFSDGEQTAKIVCSHSAVLDPEKKSLNGLFSLLNICNPKKLEKFSHWPSICVFLIGRIRKDIISPLRGENPWFRANQ